MEERKVTLLRWRMFSKSSCCKLLESKVIYKREIKIKLIIWATHIYLDIKIMLLPRNISWNSAKHIFLTIWLYFSISSNM